MYRLLTCKVKEDRTNMLMDEDVEYDQCPLSESLQDQLRQFCEVLVQKIGCRESEEGDRSAEVIELEEENSWVDNLAQLVISVPPAVHDNGDEIARHGTENFRNMVISTLRRWPTEGEIESNELIRTMFGLLLRQYTGVKEVLRKCT